MRSKFDYYSLDTLSDDSFFTVSDSHVKIEGVTLEACPAESLLLILLSIG